MTDDRLNRRKLEVHVFAGGRRLDLTGYHPYVDGVDLSNSREPNQVKLTVHNLGATNRGILSADHQAVEIFAGYDRAGKIFSGQTTLVRHRPPASGKPGWETYIEGADGQKAFRETWLSYSWPAGTPFNAIVTQIAGYMGIPVDARLSGATAAPWSFNGKAATGLSEFCADRGAQWQIYQGVLEVVAIGSANTRSTALAVEVSSSTGLVGSPEVLERKKKGRTRRFGISCRTRLNPNIRPNGLVQIKSAIGASKGLTKKGVRYETPGANGVFRVGRVAHYGSKHTEDFYTEFETEDFSA